MRIKLKRGEQSKLFLSAISKAGTENNLSKLILIPESSIYGYKNELRTLPLNRFKNLLDFLNLKKENIKIDKILEDNWGKIKGGRRLYY